MLNPADSSFRDPAGYVFRGDDGILYRNVHQSYKPEYNHLIQSGLYDSLIKKEWLVAHKEIPQSLASKQELLLQPFEVPFVSYPYEWCFSQLKDAALLTLNIQLEALQYGMTLKDASGYNITYHQNKPIFIDTLSFEKYKEGQPWIAYKQFCQHFLAPLALSAYRSPELIQVLKNYMDGIPLDLASKLLPAKSYLSLGLVLHIHLHAKAQNKLSKEPTTTQRNSSQKNILHLVSNLKSVINSLNWEPPKSVWANYYSDNNNYSESGMKQKELLTDEFLSRINVSTIWDAGANTGRFSKIASKHATQVMATDFDASAVELLYRNAKTDGNLHTLPLLSDLTNPAPAIGWLNKERPSFLERIKPDAILALAIIHHLAIANNLPLTKIAALFALKCRYLIIEFVPKEDSQVKLMLQGREDIFENYHEVGFEEAFTQYFNITEKRQIPDTSRILYLMQIK